MMPGVSATSALKTSYPSISLENRSQRAPETPRARVLALAPLLGLALALSGCGKDDAPPKEAPALTAEPGDGYNRLTWKSVAGATSYTYYWALAPEVSRQTASPVSVTGTSAIHGGLVNGSAVYYLIEAVNDSGTGPVSAEASATPQAGSAGDDPYFGLQWNLNNIGQTHAFGFSASPGEDIGVVPAWAACSESENGCRGEGVRVAVVDGDLSIAHEDLFANVASGKSRNYLNGGTDPTGADPRDFHGTAVASIIAARDANGKGLRGVAPRANLVGYNFIAEPTLANQADAMVRGATEVAVSNNSWGPSDGQGLLWPAPSSWKSAILQGLATGRGGKGTVYVWSSGNGAIGSDCATGNFPHYCSDNSNYDGYANHRGVLAVGAFNAQGEVSSYSEPGANLWVSAPGGEFCDTDHAVLGADAVGPQRGLNSSLGIGYGNADLPDTNYTQCMNGTSAAAPHVSGAAALVIQANPGLGWREVRWVLADTSRKIDPTDPGWAQNGAGHWVNHDFGFGAVDIAAAVAQAKTLSPFGTQKTYTTGLRAPALAITDNSAAGVTDSLSVPAGAGGISQIDWVEITLTAEHAYSGDLQITLTNTTTGTASILSQSHYCAPLNDSFSTPRPGDCEQYDAWTFGSARHLDESPTGTWTLKVADRRSGNTGTLQSWWLKFYGR